jgi:hypothetical protein
MGLVREGTDQFLFLFFLCFLKMSLKEKPSIQHSPDFFTFISQIYQSVILKPEMLF